MNILFLTQIIPYPPDAGPKVKTWHVLRYLVERGHKVVLASFVRPEEEEYVTVLHELCAQVYTVPIRRSRIADVYYWLRSHLTGRPFLVERDDIAEMHDTVNHILSTHSIDLIHADQLTMAQFPPRVKDSTDNPNRVANPGTSHGQTLLFDAHNAVWTIVERMMDNALFFLKPVLKLESQRVKKYEGMIVSVFEHTLAVSEIDRQALLEAVESYDPECVPDQERIVAIPIAVDTNQLKPLKRKPNSTNIMALGTLHYPPNADGIRWFIQEVFPIIRRHVPKATLTIVGKNPPKDFLEMANQHPQSIQVTGYVPILDPYLEEAALMVVPVRAGGGMRVRILESFSRGLPMVTTTIGLEGIDAIPGEDILVADNPADFAEAVIQLVQDPSLQTRLADSGRRLAETRYDWHNVLQKMDEIYITPGHNIL